MFSKIAPLLIIIAIIVCMCAILAHIYRSQQKKTESLGMKVVVNTVPNDIHDHIRKHGGETVRISEDEWEVRLPTNTQKITDREIEFYHTGEHVYVVKNGPRKRSITRQNPIVATPISEDE